MHLEPKVRRRRGQRLQRRVCEQIPDIRRNSQRLPHVARGARSFPEVLLVVRALCRPNLVLERALRLGALRRGAFLQEDGLEV